MAIGMFAGGCNHGWFLRRDPNKCPECLRADNERLRGVIERLQPAVVPAHNEDVSYVDCLKYFNRQRLDEIIRVAELAAKNVPAQDLYRHQWEALKNAAINIYSHQMYWWDKCGESGGKK